MNDLSDELETLLKDIKVEEKSLKKRKFAALELVNELK